MIPMRGKRNQPKNNKKISLFCFDNGDLNIIARPATASNNAGSVSWRDKRVGKYVHGKFFGKYALPMNRTRLV